MRVRVLCPGDNRWNLWDEWWNSSVTKNYLKGRYVSDEITKDNIAKWVNTQCSQYYMRRGDDYWDWTLGYRWPVFISAQTGKGKNYFVKYVLRSYVYDNHYRLLYVSNRVALDYQQKKELAELSLTSIASEKDDSWKEQEEFGRVTVTTYHKLGERMKDPDWCRKYQFVVLDECHFFYSDAYFNPDTWSLLEGIVKNFENSVRIYMSGTMEEVYDPIHYFEGGMLRKITQNGDVNALYKNLDYNPFYYEFEKDYSNYDLRFFTDDLVVPDVSEAKGERDSGSKLLEDIRTSGKEKWLIFVSSKEKGKQLKKAIEQHCKPTDGQGETGNLVSYIDSESRRGKNKAEYAAWVTLLEKGTFESRILIATSVLDNGFSIKDKNLKNIVLYTDNRTEFLQELGRCRLEDNMRVNLYIKKTSRMDITRLINKYNHYYEVVAACCEEERHLLNEDIHYEGKRSAGLCALEMWGSYADTRRGFLKVIPEYNPETGEYSLCPVFNMMVRWCLRKLGESILTYLEYEEDNSENAGILFKTEWLGLEHDTEGVETDLKDIMLENAICKMTKLLEEYENIELSELGEGYREFAVVFRELYVKLEGTKKINRSSEREVWGHTAMNNRLEVLRKYNLTYDLIYQNGICKLVKNTEQAE